MRSAALVKLYAVSAAGRRSGNSTYSSNDDGQELEELFGVFHHGRYSFAEDRAVGE